MIPSSMVNLEKGRQVKGPVLRNYYTNDGGYLTGVLDIDRTSLSTAIN